MSHITAAGNVEVPAFLALGQLGFAIERTIHDGGTEFWIARREDREYSATSPLEVLGLCLMHETRGSNWKATDEEIDSFLQTYYPDSLPSDEE